LAAIATGFDGDPEGAAVSDTELTGKDAATNPEVESVSGGKVGVGVVVGIPEEDSIGVAVRFSVGVSVGVGMVVAVSVSEGDSTGVAVGVSVVIAVKVSIGFVVGVAMGGAVRFSVEVGELVSSITTEEQDEDEVQGMSSCARTNIIRYIPMVEVSVVGFATHSPEETPKLLPRSSSLSRSTNSSSVEQPVP
jgi:hypothetical protein